MNLRKAMYVVIIIICIWSIAVGVQGEINKKANKKQNPDTNTTVPDNTIQTPTVEETQDDLRKNLDKMFTNRLLGSYDEDSVQKKSEDKEIIETYSKKIKNDVYELNINFPRINIKGDVADKIDKESQETFIKKAQYIISNSTDKTVYYMVSYIAFINDDILSIVIKSTLKEENNAQKVMIQTYNMNLKTGKEVTINDMLGMRNVSKDDVSTKIDETISEAIEEANSIQETGYEVYSRNIKSNIYNINKLKTFFLDKDGNLWIVFAYGNYEFTSEIDVVKI